MDNEQTSGKSKQSLPPEHVNFSRGATVYGKAPKNQQEKFTVINERGTDDRLTGLSTLVKKNRELNTEPQVKIADNSGHYEFSGATIGQHTFPQNVFQKSLDEVFEEFKRLRAQGRQPIVNITGLASSSLIPGKGSQLYANERAKEVSGELMKRGIPKSAINIETMYGPEEDPRSLTSKQKALHRGAVIDVKRPPPDGFFDERKLGGEQDPNKKYASIWAGMDELSALARHSALGPLDMHPNIGRIGRLANTIQNLFNRFYFEHEFKLIHAGLPLIDSKGNPHNNLYNGSFKGAFRHAVWQALGTYYLGLKMSRTAGDSHDSIYLPKNIKENQSFRGSDGDNTLFKADAIVDMLNNQIGQSIGSANNNARAEDICLKIVEEAYNNGLWIVESIENLGTTQKPDFEITIKKHQLTRGERADLILEVQDFFKKPETLNLVNSLDFERAHPYGFLVP